MSKFKFFEAISQLDINNLNKYENYIISFFNTDLKNFIELTNIKKSFD